MNKQRSLNRSVLSLLGASVLVFLTATLATPSFAANTTAGVTDNVAKPMQLAWWHHGWWGPRWYAPRYVVCPRTCWRGYWGYLHCVRRC